MGRRDNKRDKKIDRSKIINSKNILYFLIILFFLIYGAIFYNMYFTNNKTYATNAKESKNEIEEMRFSNANEIDLDSIIINNTKDGQVEKITVREEVLEYLTQYKTNKNIPKGISYVVQEGMQGIQEISTKSIYDKDGNLIAEEQVGTNVKKASANKIVEIGGANYTSNYKVKVKDKIYVTSDILAVWSEPSEESRKITTLNEKDELNVLEIKDSWYKISHQSITGWVKSECTIFINPNANNNIQNSTEQKSKQQLLATLSFGMNINKPSGLTLEQFKKVLHDDKDKNQIFEKNAEYFYYVERQYNINGIFVAAVGVHESAWGTSKIAINKNNLFGYGAYDSNPYNGAYTFSNFSESIDLISRVLVKYYLNPAGTNIYGGEKAVGTYFNGYTISAINTKYATDKNWANKVYSYMKYFYNKL